MCTSIAHPYERGTYFQRKALEHRGNSEIASTESRLAAICMASRNADNLRVAATRRDALGKVLVGLETPLGPTDHHARLLRLEIPRGATLFVQKDARRCLVACDAICRGREHHDHPGQKRRPRRNYFVRRPGEEAPAAVDARDNARRSGDALEQRLGCSQGRESVSYTHLTLPTILLV